jgi:hypothetical protein
MASGTALEVRTKDGVKFGKELREKDFLFQSGYRNLNHGKCFSDESESMMFGMDKNISASDFPSTCLI